jgi:peroxiredoxin
MILVLSRGHYCPKDHQQHLELAAWQPQIAVAYTKIVTISTDNIVESREFRASVGASWTFLSDAGRKVQNDLDIQEYTDPHHDPMVPHTLVLKPGLVIHSIYNGYWFWGRPSIEDLRRDLRDATREIRPDWDINTPEQRAAWDAGDRGLSRTLRSTRRCRSRSWCDRGESQYSPRAGHEVSRCQIDRFRPRMPRV